MNKDELLRYIQELAFRKTETELFLDTHPDCRDALDLYRRNLEMLEAATAEYNNKYGPLTATAAVGDSWSWIKSPWPWQLAEGDMPTAKGGKR
ncbi:MAG: spore coat protein CotJB [Clostridia bacterium]|nr:spore coat protein CotJB [Clostridia bacterium]